MRNVWGWIIGAIVVVLIVFVVVPFFADEPTYTEEEFGIGGGPEVEESMDDERGVAANEILEDPNKYMGRQVTVVSEVEEVPSDYAFSLDAAGFLDDELLVLTKNGVSELPSNDNPGLFGDRQVRVTGTVREFSTQQAEATLGRDLDDPLYNNWDGKPYIMASDVQIIGE